MNNKKTARVKITCLLVFFLNIYKITTKEYIRQLSNDNYIKINVDKYISGYYCLLFSPDSQLKVSRISSNCVKNNSLGRVKKVYGEDTLLNQTHLKNSHSTSTTSSATNLKKERYQSTHKQQLNFYISQKLPSSMSTVSCGTTRSNPCP